jgi:hypothetical protein
MTCLIMTPFCISPQSANSDGGFDRYLRQSWRRCPFGTQAHSPTRSPIMETNLLASACITRNLIKRGIYRGCRLLIPALLAIVPAMKGNAADPVCPSPAIQPMQAVSSQRGRIRPDWFMTMGYIGPRRTPMSETATAPPIRDGTSHTTSSRLGVIESGALSFQDEKANPIARNT